MTAEEIQLEDFAPGTERAHADPVDAAVIDRFTALGVSLVATELGPALTRHLAVDASTLKRVAGSGCVAGVATTVANPPGSTASLLSTIGAAQPGDALVIVGDAQTATWGELTTQLALARGIVCVIVDGVARDVARIREMGLSVWARRIYVGERPNSSIRGQVNVPVNLAGVRVRAGDVVLADDDGVLCVPRHLIEDVLKRAEERRGREVDLLVWARRGEVGEAWAAYGAGEAPALVSEREDP